MLGKLKRMKTRQRRWVSRVSPFIGVYGALLFLPGVVVAFLLLWLRQQGVGWWFVPLAVVCVLVLIAPMVYLALMQRMEGELLREQRRYHRTLVGASSGMTRVKEIQQLCRLIVYTVNRTVRLTHTCLFLFDVKEQRYVLRASRSPSLIPTGEAMGPAEPLIKLLQEDRDLVIVEELKDTLAEQPRDERGRLMSEVYEWMRKHEARLIVPSFSSERLLAFLVLGPKRSGRPYTTDDVGLFSALANQAALAIENAMVFEELRDNEAYMIQSEKLASLGQLASGMAHEIHNPLTIISGEAQLFLERFKGQDPKVDEVLMSIVEECRRAADITRRILRFAKPAPSDLGSVNLKTTIDESLALAGYQVKMDRFECAVEVPEELPKVRGNQNQLQEVLLNLIINACQAMGDKGGKLKLSASAQDSEVVVKVEDSGPGIPAGALRKVFDPFYTTKATGTGLGLFVCQRIIKAHNGVIELESEVGKGTCFTIHLPAWRDKVGKEGEAAGGQAPAPGGAQTLELSGK